MTKQAVRRPNHDLVALVGKKVPVDPNDQLLLDGKVEKPARVASQGVFFSPCLLQTSSLVMKCSFYAFDLDPCFFFSRGLLEGWESCVLPFFCLQFEDFAFFLCFWTFSGVMRLWLLSSQLLWDFCDCLRTLDDRACPRYFLGRRVAEAALEALL